MWRLTIIVFFCTLLSNAEGISTSDYPMETHQVTTKDGYILQLNRIPRGSNCSVSEDRKVVFLMHGLFALYNSFTYLGSEYAIGYNLADAGYDVWMGNARGTKYSRRHVCLDPDKDKFQFFNFSYEDVALFDLPAMIDYVLGTTKQNKLHYIGHSQGATVFFVCTSMIPAYQSKIASAHLLAAVGYEKNIPSPARILGYNFGPLYTLLRLAGFVECSLPVLKQIKVSTNTSALDLFFNLPPKLFSGAATRQFAHFCQNFKDKAFRRWDYGFSNFEKYGSLVPPSYNLSMINIDVTLHYSSADAVIAEEDQLAMARAMPNAKVQKVPDDLFTHFDYVVNEKVKRLVTDYIIESYKNSSGVSV